MVLLNRHPTNTSSRFRDLKKKGGNTPQNTKFSSSQESDLHRRVSTGWLPPTPVPKALDSKYNGQMGRGGQLLSDAFLRDGGPKISQHSNLGEGACVFKELGQL